VLHQVAAGVVRRSPCAARRGGRVPRR
jgi:hypothetical protein